MDIDAPNTDAIDERFKQTIEDGLDELSQEIEWRWRTKASSTLVESRKKYLDGLSIERFGNEIQVILKDFMSAAVEGGSQPQNLKQIFGMGRVIPMGHPPAQAHAWFHAGREMPRFRTVSNKSPWIHPGITPRKSGTNPQNLTIGEQIQKECEETIIDEVFDKIFSKLSI